MGKHLLTEDMPIYQARYRFARDYEVTWVQSANLIDTILSLRWL